MPSSDQVAAVFESNNGEVPDQRFLEITSEDGQKQIISTIDPLADPLVYPLLFPFGTHGWQRGMSYNRHGGTSSWSTVTQLDFY